MDCEAHLRNVPRGIWLAGQEVDTGNYYGVINPGNDQVLTTISQASPSHAVEALDRAHSVFPQWAATPARQRSEIIRRAYEIVVERRQELAQIMTLELGRALSESAGEVTYGAEFLRWFAEETVRIGGRNTPAPSGNGNIMVVPQPVGPCLAITPWNFPLAMGTRKIAPALAAGCPIIVKPAEDTPLTMLWLAKVFAEAGLPAGVLSVLPTLEPASIIEPLMADKRLRKISFTGSTKVGKTLLKQSADNVLRTSMELGGNAPVIVFEDADLDLAVEGTLAAKMRNGGQACTSANRIYVHSSIAAEFTDKFVGRVKKLKVGPGWDERNDVGSIVNHRQLDRISAVITESVAMGANVAVGGKKLPGPGTFLEPTVLTQVTPNMPIVHEEIFGPVATIITFDEEQSVVEQANDTPYGLASYFFTSDADRMWRVAQALEYGMVGVNRGVVSDAAAPFGGCKQSGLGREGGVEGIDEYLEFKYIAWT